VKTPAKAHSMIAKPMRSLNRIQRLPTRFDMMRLSFP
jgi:hypothetical protein